MEFFLTSKSLITLTLYCNSSLICDFIPMITYLLKKYFINLNFSLLPITFHIAIFSFEIVFIQKFNFQLILRHDGLSKKLFIQLTHPSSNLVYEIFLFITLLIFELSNILSILQSYFI